MVGCVPHLNFVPQFRNQAATSYKVPTADVLYIHQTHHALKTTNMCLYPRLITNPKYMPSKKNGGNIPELKDKRVAMVAIGCGHCIECRKQKANEWRVRLNEELKRNNNAWFITLTFSEEGINKNIELYAEKNYGEIGKENDIATIAVRYFLERWRKTYKHSCKHWLITERGHNGTERIHLHGIIWADKEKIEKLDKVWKNGYVYVGQYVNERTINYIVKYVTKTDNDHKDFEGKILCSAGLGSGYFEREKYLNTYKGELTKDYYKLPNGRITSLPIYYRNKLYTEEEREKLWLYKLDKKERFVRGIKIDISTKEGINIYLKTLKEAQKDNKKNGYGGIAWKSNIYEDILKKINKNKN